MKRSLGIDIDALLTTLSNTIDTLAGTSDTTPARRQAGYVSCQLQLQRVEVLTLSKELVSASMSMHSSQPCLTSSTRWQAPLIPLLVDRQGKFLVYCSYSA